MNGHVEGRSNGKCLDAGGASRGGWITEGIDSTDAAVIVAYLTRIVCRSQDGRDEGMVQLMASSIAASLCAVLALNSVALAAAAKAYTASMTRVQATRGEA